STLVNGGSSLSANRQGAAPSFETESAGSSVLSLWCPLLQSVGKRLDGDLTAPQRRSSSCVHRCHVCQSARTRCGHPLIIPSRSTTQYSESPAAYWSCQPHNRSHMAPSRRIRRAVEAR